MEKIEAYKTESGQIFEDIEAAIEYEREQILFRKIEELKKYAFNMLCDCPYGDYFKGNKKWNNINPGSPLIQSLIQTPELMIKIANHVLEVKETYKL